MLEIRIPNFVAMPVGNLGDPEDDDEGKAEDDDEGKKEVNITSKVNTSYVKDQDDKDKDRNEARDGDIAKACKKEANKKSKKARQDGIKYGNDQVYNKSVSCAQKASRMTTAYTLMKQNDKAGGSEQMGRVAHRFNYKVC